MRLTQMKRTNEIFLCTSFTIFLKSLFLDILSDA